MQRIDQIIQQQEAQIKTRFRNVYYSISVVEITKKKLQEIFKQKEALKLSGLTFYLFFCFGGLFGKVSHTAPAYLVYSSVESSPATDGLYQFVLSKKALQGIFHNVEADDYVRLIEVLSKEIGNTKYLSVRNKRNGKEMAKSDLNDLPCVLFQPVDFEKTIQVIAPVDFDISGGKILDGLTWDETLAKSSKGELIAPVNYDPPIEKKVKEVPAIPMSFWESEEGFFG